MAKRPYLQFYPGDWLRDNVAGCYLAAQGLWLRMMFIAHDSERYGYLQQNRKPIPPDAIARRCGTYLEPYLVLLQELDDAGIPSRTEREIIFSRRMVKDAKDREETAERVAKFRKLNKVSNGDVTPMYASEDEVEDEDVKILGSKKKKDDFVLPFWVDYEAWSAFIEMRAKNRCAPTIRAANMLVRELEKLAGHDMVLTKAILEQSAMNGWKGLFPIGGDRSNGSKRPSEGLGATQPAPELLPNPECQKCSGTGSRPMASQPGLMRRCDCTYQEARP